MIGSFRDNPIESGLMEEEHMKRRWYLCVLLAAMLALVLVGCGKDGLPGNAYLGVWVDYSEADAIYYMYTSVLPGTFHYGLEEYGVALTSTTYYLETPGTFYYEYALDYVLGSTEYFSDYWYGYMTIAVNAGAKGGLFTDGANGKDRYYDWILGWYGSTLSYDRASSASKATGLAPVAYSQQKPIELDSTLYTAGPVRTITKTDGPYTITLTERPYTLKGSLVSASKAGK